MAIQNIAIGTPGAGGGDPAYAAFTKINQNFSNAQHAASRMVGFGSGDLAQVRDLRRAIAQINIEDTLPAGWDLNNLTAGDFVFYAETSNPNNPPIPYASIYVTRNFSDSGQLTVVGHDYFNGGVITRGKHNNSWSQWAKHYHTLNTVVDGNGFIKAASPVVKLFADKIEPNDEAQLQDIAFEKLGIGDYLIIGSSGFAEEGWYIEMPKDANGNVLVAVVYEQLENNDISVKTYAKKFDDETGDIVANLTKPRDIPVGRCIDLRLQELPLPEIQIPKSIAPPDFQPTGLAEAVDTVMESYHDSEQ